MESSPSHPPIVCVCVLARMCVRVCVCARVCAHVCVHVCIDMSRLVGTQFHRSGTTTS